MLKGGEELRANLNLKGAKSDGFSSAHHDLVAGKNSEHFVGGGTRMMM
jgi:hypothetical protein